MFQGPSGITQNYFQVKERLFFKFEYWEVCQKYVKRFEHLTEKITDHYETLLNYPFNQRNNKIFQKQKQKFTLLLPKLAFTIENFHFLK